MKPLGTHYIKVTDNTRVVRWKLKVNYIIIFTNYIVINYMLINSWNIKHEP